MTKPFARIKHSAADMKPKSNILSGAVSLMERRNFSAARKELQKINPCTAEQQNLIGVSYLIANNFNKAKPYFKRALAIDKNCIAAAKNLNMGYLQENRPLIALEALRAIDPKEESEPLSESYGHTYLQLDDPKNALKFYLRAELWERVSKDEIHLGIGLSYLRLGVIDQAQIYHAKIKHKLSPKASELYIGILLEQHLYRECRDFCQKTITSGVLTAFIACALGISQSEIESNEISLSTFRKYYSAFSDDHNFLYNFALTLKKAGLYDESINLLIQHLNNFKKQKKVLTLYGNLLLQKGKTMDAISYLRQVVEKFEPSSSDFYNLGNANYRAGQLTEAQSCFKKSMATSNATETTVAMAIHTAGKLADWDYQQELIGKHSMFGISNPAPPFAALAIEDDPEKHLARAETWASHLERSCFGHTICNQPRTKLSHEDSLIRLGYFSGDFYEHATMFLLKDVLKRHNRTRFRIYLFDYSPVPISKQQGVLEWLDPKDIYYNIKQFTNEQIKELALSINLDIAIDLKGYTRGSRSEIFFQRLAPIQINFLGYPGSLGTRCYDYMVADSFTIPKDYERYYSEKIIRIDPVYQPNSATSFGLSQHKSISRAEEKLPTGKLILSSFNQPYKIRPAIFECWLEALKVNMNSILWMYSQNSDCERNLLRYAERRGVSASRIVFAENRPNADHLKRIPLADLALDTFPVNGHTTSSDSLRCGVPVITQVGQHFSTRVTGSLLSSLQFDETNLITRSREQYQQRLIELVSSPNWLNQLRSELAAAKSETATFNPTHYIEKWEAELFRIVNAN